MRNRCCKWEFFGLSLSNRLGDHKQFILKDYMPSFGSSWGNFPSHVFEVNMTVAKILFSSCIINDSCNIDNISWTDKILVTTHKNFDNAVIGTTPTTLWSCKLLFLNNALQLSQGLQNIQILGVKLIIIFSIWWNKLRS